MKCRYMRIQGREDSRIVTVHRKAAAHARVPKEAMKIALHGLPLFRDPYYRV